MDKKFKEMIETVQSFIEDPELSEEEKTGWEEIYHDLLVEEQENVD